MTSSRRDFLRIAVGAGAAVGLTACGGTSGPKSSDGASGGSGTAAKGSTSYWFLNGQPQQAIRENAVKRFNAANSKTQIKYTEFQNDAYKAKIKTAIGAGKAPTIIWGWGGGGLKSYVDAGQVEDLTSWFADNSDVKDRLFPSSFGAATVDGKIYALPCETVQPIVMYYNKTNFEKINADLPQTWGDIMDLVPKFNAKGIAPFALGGQSRWTNMMWLEFLFDRIGGPEVFQAVFDGEKDAWSNPASIQALTEVQKLIKAHGFIKGFSSIAADGNADQALLHTGKAAMMLHGAWCYGSMAKEGGDFVSGGHLAYSNFPTVEGGKGDPSNTVGNPGQYLSISSKSSAAEKAVAKKFFATGVSTDAESKEWVASGGIPIVDGSDSLLVGKDADWLKFQYGVASNAKTFAQSWDQALSPTAAEVLLDNIAKLFQLAISPQQYADNMNKVIGT